MLYVVQQISQLQVQVTTTQDQLLPKKKFAFKSRPKKAAPAKPNPTPTLPSSVAAVSTPSASLGAEIQSGLGFRGREKELLTLPVSLPLWCTKPNRLFHLQSTEIHSCDLNLSDLKDCEVKLFGPPVTLHMSNMENCWLDLHKNTMKIGLSVDLLCPFLVTVYYVALCPALCLWTTAKTAHL